MSAVNRVTRSSAAKDFLKDLLSDGPQPVGSIGENLRVSDSTSPILSRRGEGPGEEWEQLLIELVTLPREEWEYKVWTRMEEAAERAGIEPGSPEFLERIETVKTWLPSVGTFRALEMARKVQNLNPTMEWVAFVMYSVYLPEKRHDTR